MTGTVRPLAADGIDGGPKGPRPASGRWTG